MSQSKICARCKTSLSLKDRFCPSCGIQIKRSEPTSQEEPTATSESVTEANAAINYFSNSVNDAQYLQGEKWAAQVRAAKYGFQVLGPIDEEIIEAQLGSVNAIFFNKEAIQHCALHQLLPKVFNKFEGDTESLERLKV